MLKIFIESRGSQAAANRKTNVRKRRVAITRILAILINNIIYRKCIPIGDKCYVTTTL